MNDIAGTALKHGELLKLPGTFAAFRELLQVGGLVLACGLLLLLPMPAWLRH